MDLKPHPFSLLLIPLAIAIASALDIASQPASPQWQCAEQTLRHEGSCWWVRTNKGDGK